MKVKDVAKVFCNDVIVEVRSLCGDVLLFKGYSEDVIGQSCQNERIIVVQGDTDRVIVVVVG